MPFSHAPGFKITALIWGAALLTLLPVLLAGFMPRAFAAAGRRFSSGLLLALPSLLCVPYLLVTYPLHYIQLGWVALYAALPVTIAALLFQASRADHAQRGDWRDYFVLLALGLAVDLRWFERAWPPHLAVFNKMLLLDAGIYGFILVRQLDGIGFDLRLSARDLKIGLREFVWYTPIAVVLGVALGFLHFHAVLPRPGTVAGALLFTFAFIAIPEELFFRGWMQNLLERRIGRTPALIVTALVFGLSHFNKRALHFNWRYVLLAAIAGIFYGRAWRRDRRIGASAITHAVVDTVWSQWLR